MWACCKACYAKTTVRIPIAVMAFCACFMSYTVRLGLNLAIIAMVIPYSMQKGGPECDPDTVQTNATKEAPDFGPRYDWSASVQGHVKAAYGYGYFVAHFPAGVLADALGPRLLVLGSILVQGLLTALVPLASSLHWGAVFGLRLVIGLSGGVVYPSLHHLVAHWAPPQEKGKFIFALMGGSFSAVVTMPVMGVVVEALGWQTVYYLTTVVCGVFGAAWFLVVFDSPSAHPAISEEERDFILEAQGGTVREGHKRRLPLKRVLLSVPFWALVILHYGNLWGLFLLTTDTPVFLSEVLGFSITKSGVINSLPTLGRCIMALVFGSTVDALVSRNMLKNKSLMRKAFVISSHVLPGALMLGLAFVGCDVAGAVALLTLGLSFNGASTVTNLVNHHDLAPNYAGSLYGFMNGFGCTTLFIVPSLNGWLLSDHNGLAEWRYIFLIGSGFYIMSGVIFWFIGSANIQSWNDPDAPEPSGDGPKE